MLYCFMLGIFFNDIIYFLNKYILIFIDKNLQKNKILSLFIKNKYIIYKYKLNSLSSWIKILFFLNILYYIFKILYNILIIDLKDINYMSDNNINNTNNNSINVNNPNLNINTPNVKITIPGVLPSIIGAASIRAGMQVAKHVPSIGGKIAATAGTAAFVAGATSFGQNIGTNSANVLTKGTSNTGDNINKFLPDIINLIDLNSLTGKVEGLETYPLSLLKDMLLINYSSILFLILMFNVFIAIFFKNKDISNNLPKWIIKNDNKISKFIKIFINKYIQIWYRSKNFILIYS